jgi:hypothetical protein
MTVKRASWTVCSYAKNILHAACEKLQMSDQKERSPMAR